MQLSFSLIFNSILLGVGLAMDAFSVSLANGLCETCMTRRKMYGIAGVFAFFQFAMPMIGWICISTVLQYFKLFEYCIPYIALGLLGFIGGKMLCDGIKNTETEKAGVGFIPLLIQGVATSIDALSVGFTISDYNLSQAFCSSLIIAAVTFIICTAGVLIGKKVGTKLLGKAEILGGCILIFIGLEIFITSFF